MKKIVIAGACVALMTTAGAWAGEGEGKQGGDRKARMERMKTHLQLSDEQVSQMREIRQSGGGREEVRAVLTQEQQEKWDEARAKHGKHRQNSEAD